MAKYVIEDTTLTGIADAIRGKTGGTAPIPVTDMATQIAAITGGGDSAETLVTLLGEQTLEFALNTTFNLYSAYIEPAPFVPVIGETYTVVWDGVEYECVAQDAGAILAGAVFIGNAEAFGLNGNNEPFIIGGDASSGTNFFSLTDTASSTHTVAIYQKSPGGGSVEGIVYVTFTDGDVELCKTACMKGDCSIDPVECAKIAVPTKEPTVDTVYTYAGGWALTDGGEADEMALIDVTEDRVVYAVYTESVREYTINFWLAEGELHESLQVPYGQVPSPTEPEKTGYYFDGWTPELSAVTGDADYVSVWSEASPWETVAAAIANGTYKSLYKVGDIVPLDLGDYGTVDMQIIAFDADTKEDGSGTAAISWLSKNLIANHAMNSASPASNANGWKASEMRSWLRSEVWALLPEDVKNAIVSVNKTYYDYSTTSTLTCQDTVWIPSYREMFGGTTGEGSGAVYSGYFSNDASRMKGKGTSAEIWWLRTANTNSTQFRTVGSTGSVGYSSSARSTFGVALGFCT